MNTKNIMQPTGPKIVKFKGFLHELVEQNVDVAGKVKTFEYAVRPPGVRLIFIKENKVLVSKEFRNELQEYDYRLPGGKVFDSLDEYNKFLNEDSEILKHAEVAAKREAEEEVGIKFENMELLQLSHCGATIRWDLYYFLISEFDEDHEAKTEAGEDIEYGWYTFKEAWKMLGDYKIKEDRSVAVLFRFLKDKI